MHKWKCIKTHFKHDTVLLDETGKDYHVTELCSITAVASDATPW